MKRIWIFVPDIFFTLLIVMSCERMSLEQDGFVEGNEDELWTFTEKMSSQGNSWDERISDYKGKAKELLEKLNLEL